MKLPVKSIPFWGLFFALLLPLCIIFIRPTVFAEAQQQSSSAPVIKVKELERIAREGGHYTQGLFFHNGSLYETTGQYRSGAVYRIDPATGKTLEKAAFPSVFLEGSTVLDGVFHVLTWQDGVRLEIDPTSLRQLGKKPLHGQGWGLCSDGQTLWKSDGSPALKQYETSTGNTAWKPLRHLIIVDGDKPVSQLNELEWVQGRIWANIYGSPYIAVIDQSRTRWENGQELCPVVFWLDCSELLPEEAKNPENVLNGIAWDVDTGTLLLTGKMWPFFSRIALPQPQ